MVDKTPNHLSGLMAVKPKAKVKHLNFYYGAVHTLKDK
jgi:hypothetical protein